MVCIVEKHSFGLVFLSFIHYFWHRTRDFLSGPLSLKLFFSFNILRPFVRFLFPVLARSLVNNIKFKMGVKVLGVM